MTRKRRAVTWTNPTAPKKRTAKSQVIGVPKTRSYHYHIDGKPLQIRTELISPSADPLLAKNYRVVYSYNGKNGIMPLEDVNENSIAALGLDLNFNKAMRQIKTEQESNLRNLNNLE